MKEIRNLLKLKSLLSLMFCITTCYLAITNKISMEVFVGITMSIITYYFNKDENTKDIQNESE